VTLSTSGDQTAIAPGYLQKHWPRQGATITIIQWTSP
jgi:hypothetical protein